MTELVREINVLANAAVRGDRSAIELLLAEVQPLVLRYCRGRIGRQDRTYACADEVAQETCFAVIKALPTYRDQGRPFLAFVYGIASHKVADAHRAAARNRSEPVADAAEWRDGPQERAEHSKLSDTLAKLMNTLPAKQRDILVLRVYVGLTAEETADVVGSTPGAVRVAQHRALGRLRKHTEAIIPQLSAVDTKDAYQAEPHPIAATSAYSPSSVKSHDDTPDEILDNILERADQSLISALEQTVNPFIGYAQIRAAAKRPAPTLQE